MGSMLTAVGGKLSLRAAVAVAAAMPQFRVIVLSLSRRALTRNREKRHHPSLKEGQ